MSERGGTSNSAKLACPRCGINVIVDAQFRDTFYCNRCGRPMKYA